MIILSRKFIFAAAALFSMVLITGCAQSRTNIKSDEAAVQTEAAVILSVKPSSDASQVEVTSNKPLSYTYYKTSDPPRVVLDLAQTDPGNTSGVTDVNVGNIKNIEISKHEFTGGFLSRVEIVLSNDENDFSVNADAADKGKLLVTLGSNGAVDKNGADSINSVASEAKENAEASVPVEQKDENIAAAAVTPAVSNQEAPVPPDPPQKNNAGYAPVVAADAKQDAENKEAIPSVDASVDNKTNEKTAIKTIRSIAAVEDGIEIKVDGGVDTFNAFKLSKPDRIVIDLPGVKSAIAGKSVDIGKLNITRVRQGFYPEKVRLVLDAEKDALPQYQVVKNQEGIKVTFKEVPGAVAEKTLPAPVEKTAQTGKLSPVTSSVVESIDFQIVDDFSRITIKTSGRCKAGEPVKVGGGFAVSIKDCRLPAKLQRMIDTSAFPSAVQMITPYEVKRGKGHDTRVVAKLIQATSTTFRQDGNTVYWEFKNPEKVVTAIGEKVVTAEGKAASPVYMKNAAAKQHEAIEVQGKPVVTPASYGDKKVYTGRRVSLEFSDADIRKILQLIAEVSNLNFIIGDDVSGTISIKLVNVPWDQALDVILDSKGLEKRQDGNIMYIKPKGKFKTEEQEEAEAKQERERRMELKTKVYDINFADVGDISKQFEKLKSERGTIAQDDRTNRVIVTDIEDRLVKMSYLLKQLDLPEKQVMIEARIVEATSTFTRDLGVQWGIHYKDGSASFLGINQADVGLGGIVTPPPSTGTFGVDSAGGAAGFSFGKLTSNVQLDLRLSAAATIGQVKVISTPKVITLNNKAAKISQGQSIPYQTTSAEGTKTEFIEAALTLEVTPHVAADGTISMKIKATNNSAGQPVQGSTQPPINKKEATTEVQVRNGETTVIGGIYQDNDTESDTGVPFLQDIPLLGWLFKSNSKQKTKTELLIFITPKIVS